MNSTSTFIILSLASKHLTSILSDSYLTQPLRDWVVNHNGFIGYGVNCFFCTSTWVSIIISFFFMGGRGDNDLSLMHLLIYGLAVASAANIIESLLTSEE